MPKRYSGLLLGVLGVVVLAVGWEAYKAIGPATGVVLGGHTVLPRTSDRAMPHVWDMVGGLADPAVGRRGESLGLAVVHAMAFSLRIAAVGWVMGVVVGVVLALIMVRVRLAEAAVLPWVVLSQTVPLIAIAPLVGRWGAHLRVGPFAWTDDASVAVIAAYLAFFPVAVGLLRGLKSPEPTHLDLMRTYGVGWGRSLLALRLPASVPYLLPALRLAAASAVIGTVVAEVSIGLRGGLGRMVIEFAQSAGGNPAKPWAPIFGTVIVGLLAAGFVALIGAFLRAYRRTEVTA